MREVLVYLFYSIMAIGNLGFFMHSVLKMIDGDHSKGICFIAALNLVAGIYCLISGITFRAKEFDD